MPPAPDTIPIQSSESKRRQLAARAFSYACGASDLDLLYQAAIGLDETRGWKLAMKLASRLPSVSREVQYTFESLWVERKGLSLTVGHRPTVAKALRVLFPGNYLGEPLRLYRGTRRGERRRRHYGFSWTTDKAIAQSFADTHSETARSLAKDLPKEGPFAYSTDLEGLLLETVVPPEAILLMRELDGHYDESEVVVDPFRLGRITVVAHK